jgi:tetratricopeptide (TPR) repeat protein
MVWRDGTSFRDLTIMNNKTPVLNKHVTVMAVCLAALGTPAWAQTNSVPSQTEVDQVFRDVLANPSSIDIRSKYATLLVQSGNYEGGIAALEGLLLVPDAPANIRLELAVLYYRLGSYAMSEAYLRDALADPRLDAKQKNDAQSLLSDVTARNKTSRLSGMVMLGLRAQTNPTGATDNGTVLYQGLSVPRSPDFAPKSDTDVHAWALLDHVYDLEKQNEASTTTRRAMRSPMT